MNEQPLHVSSTTCSSSGGAALTTIGMCVCIMSAGCYQNWNGTLTLVAASPEDEQVVLGACRGW
jgi:hypothetical protein